CTIKTTQKRPGMDDALADQILNMPQLKIKNISTRALRLRYFQYVTFYPQKFCEGENFKDIVFALKMINRSNNTALKNIATKMGLQVNQLNEILTLNNSKLNQHKELLVKLYAEYVNAG